MHDVEIRIHWKFCNFLQILAISGHPACSSSAKFEGVETLPHLPSNELYQELLAIIDRFCPRIFPTSTELLTPAWSWRFTSKVLEEHFQLCLHPFFYGCNFCRSHCIAAFISSTHFQFISSNQKVCRLHFAFLQFELLQAFQLDLINSETLFPLSSFNFAVQNSRKGRI